MLPHHW